MAGGPDGLAEVDQGVPVAVGEHARHVDEVPGRLPLAPPLRPGPAVERGQPAWALSILRMSDYICQPPGLMKLGLSIIKGTEFPVLYEVSPSPKGAQ